jgi:hypothetical protein
MQASRCSLCIFWKLLGNHASDDRSSRGDMMTTWPVLRDWLVTALGIVCAIWLLRTLFAPRSVLKIRIHDGRPSVQRGKVTQAFLVRVADGCREGGVARGWIVGVKNGKRISLRFSRSFPPALRQRLRNEWTLAG